MKLLRKIGQIFLAIWNWRKNWKIKQINKKLKKAVENQEKERILFLDELKLYLRKYLRKDASGKYIPIKGKNRAEIYETVMHMHGARMKELNIKFSKKLKLSL
jgi:adenosyl cobinamide kinase/adenosyl cobinamide phosphate guanylyltransferase